MNAYVVLLIAIWALSTIPIVRWILILPRIQVEARMRDYFDALVQGGIWARLFEGSCLFEGCNEPTSWR